MRITYKNLGLYTCVLISLANCATTNSQNITASDIAIRQQYISTIQENLANKNSDAALTITKSLIKSNPNDDLAYSLQARAYQQQNDLSDALQSSKTALNLKPNDITYSTQYASLLCQNQNYKDGNSNLQEIIKTNQKITNKKVQQQNNALIYSALGDCYLSQKDFDLAVENYDTAIQTKYASDNTYINITNAYIEQKNYPKAALYINSYPGNDTIEVIKLKIQSLSGLLTYDITDKNKQLLKSKISQLKTTLRTLENSSKNLKPVIAAPIINNNSHPKNTNTATLTVSKAPQAQPTINNKTAGSSFASRIKTSTDGRKYIVVTNGDTLFGISKQSGVTKDKIIRINSLKNDYAPLNTRIYLN